MNYRQLPLRCECGRTPSTLRSVGLAAGRQLVVHWRCPACRKLIYVFKSLSDCWRDCPEPSDWPEEAVAGGRLDLEADDVRFLHELGVVLPDDGEQ